MERRAHLLGVATLTITLTIALAGGCAAEQESPGSRGGTGAPAPIPVTSRLENLKFSHVVHLFNTKVVRNDKALTCLDCHAGVDKSDDLDVSFIPDHDRDPVGKLGAGCAGAGCHAPASMPATTSSAAAAVTQVKATKTSSLAACDKCHVSDAERYVRTAPLDHGLNFSHKNHVARVYGNCMRCHTEVATSKDALTSLRPPMETCTDGCHKEDLVSSNCRRCHRDLMRYPLESVRFLSHGGKFVERHGDSASSPSAPCASCHDRSFCSDCHSNTNVFPADTKLFDRSTRTFIHPAPYETIHALDARAKRDTCETCHRTNFCNSCHASNGLAALDRVREAPHPVGWLQPGSVSFHGLEARREITACAGCHDQGAASICVRCHQVGGSGGNPHPAGFARRDEPTKNRMCRTCHWR